MSNSSMGCLTPILAIFFFFSGIVLFPAQPSTETSVDSVTIATSIEVTLVPEDSNNYDALLAAGEVISERMLMLAENGQIGSTFSTSTGQLGMEIVLRFDAGTLTTDEVIAVLTQPGYIEFVDLTSVPATALEGYTGQSIATSAGVARSGDDRGQIVFPTIITHEAIAGAIATENDFGGFQITIELTPEGAETLGDFTQNNVGFGMAIVLDGEVLTAPTIQSRVASPIVLTGQFTEAEARALAAQINSQPLPIPLILDSVTESTP